MRDVFFMCKVASLAAKDQLFEDSLEDTSHTAIFQRNCSHTAILTSALLDTHYETPI